MGQLETTPVDFICKHHGGLHVCSGFCSLHDVAAGAAHDSVTGVVNLAAGVVDKSVDVVGATSLLMGAYGLIESG